MAHRVDGPSDGATGRALIGATGAGEAAMPDQARSAALPVVSLPKGGGAIRGIGEKFASNPVTGTGTLSIPLPTSPGRSGFTPQLLLSYDSGSGNGPFGIGWALSLPSITRKTDRGLPRYVDADETDVYLLSGAEDLVPVLRPDGTRSRDGTTAPDYFIDHYRPRVEGLFARIERWTHRTTGEIHWRSITRDNVTTVFGTDAGSRIVDPRDPSPAHPTRIFTWLIRQSWDDRGNAATYEYVGEDDRGVDRTRANERNRERTANRYLKRIAYGNRVSALVQPDLSLAEWLFEVVLDYDEGHEEPVPADPGLAEGAQHRFVLAASTPGRPWTERPDPFSSYRSGFEIRTSRRCRRVFMYHHIPDLPTGEPGYDGLVRSLDLDYADLDNADASVEDELAHPGSTRYASFLCRVTERGHVLQAAVPPVVRNGVSFRTYLTTSMPPLDFEYTKATIRDRVVELGPVSLENLPAGLAGRFDQLVDLHGEGLPGVLSDSGDAWYYRRNLSPLHDEAGPDAAPARLAALELVGSKPSGTLAAARAQFMDLAGDGQPDVVNLEGPVQGFFEHDDREGWQPFTAFASPLARSISDPNVRLLDLDGDGRADVLVSGDDAFSWHASLGEAGFGPARRVFPPLDEEHGPRLVLADGTQSIFLADMSGDGLTDLVRISNGEVCYWPNIGYGSFGPRVSLDNAPWFGPPEVFDQGRIRLADIDGSGTTDIIYLAEGGVRLYFNQAGNRLSDARHLHAFPRISDAASVTAADLLGNGTACLIWSSPLGADAGRAMRYVDLMGPTKPHLLTRSVNNLGAETSIVYAPSTKFYLADREQGRPWVTRLPFPVHVVERVITDDRISGNRFVSRYAYHHGYFDGAEREFRGFGMVEQWDTESFAGLAPGGAVGALPTNLDPVSHVPPVLTRTWFHTGATRVPGRVTHGAGVAAGEYYREPGLTDDEALALLLDDSMLPPELSADEQREATRALKGQVLRQEIYALDGTGTEAYPFGHPYSVLEQRYAVRVIQRRGTNRHAVFLTHPRESIAYHYEREPSDPRVSHAVTIDVDDFGNVHRSASIGYGRRAADPTLSEADQATQARLLVLATDTDFTNRVDTADAYRVPVPFESRSYEATSIVLPPGATRLAPEALDAAIAGAAGISYGTVPTAGTVQQRLVERTRVIYRRDDLGGPLPLGVLEARALPFESYRLAFDPGLAATLYGGRVAPSMLLEGGYADIDGDGAWWVPSGRISYTPVAGDGPAAELALARQHFFLPCRYRDPFPTAATDTDSFITHDAYDLLVQESRDPLGNRITVGERAADASQPPVALAHDYRVLQPAIVMDPNRNRSAVAFDALGMVVGTAWMGKPAPAPAEGDTLDGFRADLTPAEVAAILADPDGADTSVALASATSRIVYDISSYARDPDLHRPAVAATVTRETHVSQLAAGATSPHHVMISYSDGLGREIQKKVEAEAGPVPLRGPDGSILLGANGEPQLSANDIAPRWVGSGWTVFNNKGAPVRRYEPFFSDTHRFEFDVRAGVSAIVQYDPVGRIVATVHPDHTWEKVVVDAWRQAAWDGNDTILIADPSADTDVGGAIGRLPPAAYLPTWHTLRTDPALAVNLAAQYPDADERSSQAATARATEVHGATPTITSCDPLGRTFLTVAHNAALDADAPAPQPRIEERFATRLVLDIEGNHRSVVDALDRVAVRYDYDMLGNRAHLATMDAGERWTLNDVAGKPLRSWDSRGNAFRTTYDALRRPVDSLLDDGHGAPVLLTRCTYGEGQANGEALNLRAKAVELRDQAGVIRNDEYDFRGNLRRGSRQFTVAHATTIDWSSAVPLQSRMYTTPRAMTRSTVRSRRSFPTSRATAAP